MRTPRALVLCWATACTWQSADDPDHFAPDPPGATCDYMPCSCRVEATALVPPTVTTAPVIVQGTARHLEGHAIRSIVVAAEAVKSDSFNYGSWSVTLDRAALEALPRANGDDAGARVELPIEIVDEWGKTCVQRNRLRFQLALTPASAPATAADGGS